MLKLLTEGDSASVKLPVDSIFKGGSKSPAFKGKFATYYVKVEKLIPRDGTNSQAFKTAVNDYVQALNLSLKNSEPEKIRKYIADKKLIVTKSDSGIYRVMVLKGKGPLPVKGDTVVINYTGSLLSGKMFETNIPSDAVKGNIGTKTNTYDPIGIPLGEGKIIPGIEQSLFLLNKGSEAKLIIPSKFAYGEHGKGTVIAPFTPVVFRIQIANIIHPKKK